MQVMVKAFEFPTDKANVLIICMHDANFVAW